MENLLMLGKGAVRAILVPSGSIIKLICWIVSEIHSSASSLHLRRNSSRPARRCRWLAKGCYQCSLPRRIVSL